MGVAGSGPDVTVCLSGASLFLQLVQLVLQDVAAFPGRSPPLPDSHGWYGIAGPAPSYYGRTREQETLPNASKQDRVHCGPVGALPLYVDDDAPPSLVACFRQSGFGRGQAGAGRRACNLGQLVARDPS